MKDLIAAIAEKKARLDALRPLSQAALKAVQRSYDVELTYASNAIEGNTLTLRETAELIEHGITVGGKSIRDHLEALDHYDAVIWMREAAAEGVTMTEAVVRELHRRVVARSQPDFAGVYSKLPRRIAGSSVVFPDAAKIPMLMSDFGDWLKRLDGTPEASFEAYYRLVAIHPFGDGNGRTARLLMNLLLLRGGYPPISVRPVDRSSYLSALEYASVQEDIQPFQEFMNGLLNDTLDEYLNLLIPAV